MKFADVDYSSFESVLRYAVYLAMLGNTQYVVKYANHENFSITVNPIEQGITIFWSSDKGLWGIGGLA